MKRLYTILLCLILLPGVALGQTNQRTGTIATNGDCVTISTLGTPNGTISITGTWTGTISFTANIGTAAFDTLALTPIAGGAAVTSTTANGRWIFGIAYTSIKACATASITGTATVDFLVTSARGSSGGSGSTLAAGSDTQVQFNDGGVFGADADFAWDKTNNILSLGSNLFLKPIGNDNAVYYGPNGFLHLTTAAGLIETTFSTSSISYVSGIGVGWTSSATDTYSTARDTTLSRDSAGIMLVTGNGTVTGIRWTATTFANLPAATNGTQMYCSDCDPALTMATCASAATKTGAMAFRLNSAWICGG